jgi:cyclopropane-fatty-acyl-phospholipid synthase
MNLKTIIDSTLRRLDGANFAIRYWDGDTISYGDGAPQFTLGLTSAAKARSVLNNLMLRVPEAYVDGDIEFDGDLQQLFKLCCGNEDTAFDANWRHQIYLRIASALHRNSLSGSRTNISHHYDLGNDFFAVWLDEQMVYSCAYFRHDDDDLDKAQQQKLGHLCGKLRMEPGQRLLDIGCGWGALALHAAREYGVDVTGITLSDRQRLVCEAKARQYSLDDRVRVWLKDYRELGADRFDRVVSVGMLEHVGRSFLGKYMRVVSECLHRGGVGVIQTMGKTNRAEVTPWITKYIFPGMYLPTLSEIANHMSNSGLYIRDVENLREHYAKTLDAWIVRFERNAQTIARMFDERFVRMWRTYLNMASAAFKFDDLNLWQITFTNGPHPAPPLTREYLYAPQEAGAD